MHDKYKYRIGVTQNESIKNVHKDFSNIFRRLIKSLSILEVIFVLKGNFEKRITIILQVYIPSIFIIKY